MPAKPTDQLQAAVDEPALFDGVFIVNPNFREVPYVSLQSSQHVPSHPLTPHHCTTPLPHALAAPLTPRRTPHARQAHEAEQPELLRPFTVPLLNAVQGGLRKYGQPVFDALANPSTVKTILKEPYANAEQAAPYRLGRAR